MPRPPILKQPDWKKIWKNGKTYRQWLQAAEEKKNAGKMEELRKNLQIDPADQAALEPLPRTVHVLAIAEDWCGDVHRHVPILAALEKACKPLKVRFIMREDSPDVFARFLTNGGEAIPKFVFFNDKFVECGNWGPMPDACRRLISRGKAAGDVGAARKRVAAMYEADPNGEIVVRELMDLLQIAVCRIP